MTLYNKDGTVYKLNSPNPIMNNQDIWEDFTLHNMRWDEEKHQGKLESKPFNSDIKIRDSFIEDLETTKEPQVDILERKSLVQPKVDIKISNSNSEFDKTFIHYLPATIRERQDHLYGESYQTIQYGDPSSFEGIIVKEDDLELVFWTDLEEINIGSIIYPKMNSKRWWRIQNKEKKTKGWLISANPSDYQPSFDV